MSRPELDRGFKKLLDKELSDLLDKRWLSFYVGGSALILGYSALDYFVAPDLFWRFLGWRIGMVVFGLGLGLLDLYGPQILEVRIWYAPFGYLLTAGMIEAMVLKLGGHTSIYYAGLILVGSFTILAYVSPKPMMSFILAALIQSIYAVPILIYDKISNPVQFLASNVFLGSCLLVFATGKAFFDRNLLQRLRLEYELKTAQTQLIQASKLASIGTLAAGIAHEINNPLAIIQGYVDVFTQLGADGEVPPVVIDKSTRIKGAIERISRIVRGLSLYARVESDGAVPVDFHQIIEQTLSMVETIYNKTGIRIEKHLGSKCPFLLASTGRLEQVLINLMSNAKDALENRRVDKCITIVTKDSGPNFILELSDNGAGMSDEIKRQIFDPFYTTKPPGKGTGLGLAIVESICSSFSGKIEVHSDKGSGSTFRITFPAIEMHSRETTKPTSKPSMQYTGSALVVDDEPDIRDILHQYLSSMGLTVQTASDGEEALQCLKAKSFDYVFTDIQMPNLPGDTLIRQAKENGISEAYFIIITGGNTAQEELSGLADAWLTKPISKLAVAKALSGKRGPKGSHRTQAVV